MQNLSPIKSVVIVGGGTAGWMAAASLSKYLSGTNIDITVIESSDIGAVGVGEASLPSLREFNRYLGIDELSFIQATQATFKLGIKFVDWSKLGSDFFHPFAAYGQSLAGVDFHQHWNRTRLAGSEIDLEQFCLASQLAKHEKFSQPNPQNTHPLGSYNYAYHFDAIAYARMLRGYAENNQVTCINQRIEKVELDEKLGDVSQLMLADGNVIQGDFFIDCSGFKGLVIEQALHTGYEDWSHWLPCNSAVAVACKTTRKAWPYTQSTAMDAGWRWRIPLQNRLGNGYVYCSDYITEQQATEQLLQGLEGEALTAPNQLKFVTGRRKKMWNKNCVAVGLASGFMEPLESTSIALIQSGISAIHKYFPFNGVQQIEVAEANRFSQLEFERIRDFLILHYKGSQRDDSDFWRYCQNMSIPESLQHKIELYKARGHLIKHEAESFEDASWLSIYSGLEIFAGDYDKRSDVIALQELKERFTNMQQLIQQGVKQMPSHAHFIEKHCVKKS